MNRVYNFSAGPSMLPESVLRKAAAEMLDYEGSGQSVMEMSHRSKVYDGIIKGAEQLLREVMQIPDNYKVLFIQGGATLQFAMIPLNFAVGGIGNYAVDGVWSRKAFNEAQKIGEAAEVACTELRAPRQDELAVTDGAAYLYYCSNETVNGIRYWYRPEVNVPLIADMSSDFLSQPVDISKYGLIFAGAQKNFGPAGLTVVIARKDLLGRAESTTPTMLDYQTYANFESMYNTPPTYGIYMAGLTFDYLLQQGGVAEMEKRNVEKAKILYDYLDESALFHNPVRPCDRSLMNVTFVTGDADKDAAFVKAATAAGFVNLKGHRTVGGMRASIYNAMPVEGIEKLVAFMKQFEVENK